MHNCSLSAELILRIFFFFFKCLIETTKIELYKCVYITNPQKNTKKCYYSLIIVIPNGYLWQVAIIPLQNRSHSPISLIILAASIADGSTEPLKITSFLCFHTFHNTTMNFVTTLAFLLSLPNSSVKIILKFPQQNLLLSTKSVALSNQNLEILSNLILLFSLSVEY